MVVAVWWFLKKTRAGLILRAVGENDLSAHSIGYSVIGVRYAAVAFGGAMAGIAGACFPLLLTPQWAERHDRRARLDRGGAGRLRLVAAVPAARGRLSLRARHDPRALLPRPAASSSASIPSELWAALPYLATIVVLVLISMRPRRQSTSAPACLGKPFLPST